LIEDEISASRQLAELTGLLTKRGFLAASEEAQEILVCAGADDERLEQLVTRRLAGEPLAWITGSVSFCDVEVSVEPGVYVPRWHTESLARRAVACLPTQGTAIDLCTGSGAIAKVMMTERPGARIVACDLDQRAVACAARNGVDVYAGDLFAGLPTRLHADVIVGVVPYVPTGELGLLQRDTFTFESSLGYDGGPDGTALLRRAITDSRRFLRLGGTLLLELGGSQAQVLRRQLRRLRFRDIAVLHDEEGDPRGIAAKLAV
jgi:release factor glutamine methyltransferase